MNRLEQKLSQIRSSVVRLRMTGIVLQAAAVLGAGLFAAVALDVMMRFDRPTRLLLAAAVLGGAAWAFLREYLSFKADSATDKGVAHYLELAKPELKDQLISAYEFTHAEDPSPRFNSPELVQAVVAEAEQLVATLEAGKLMPKRRLQQWGGACAGLLVLCGAAAGLSPAFRTGFLRTLSDARFPQRTFYRSAVPLAADFRVAKGDKLDMKIEPDPAHPQTYRPAMAAVFYRLRSEAGSPFVRQPMNAFEDGSFSWSFEGLQEGLEFRIECDDFQTPACAVTVIERPRLDDLTVMVEPPAYTGEPKRTLHVRGKGATESGDLQEVAGTVVRLVGTANKPLSAAVLRIGQQELPAEVSDRQVTATFTVDRSDVYSLRLTDREPEKFQDDAPIQYNIRAKNDQTPMARITYPAKDLDLTPNAALPIEVEASDDYGLKSIQLEMNLTDANDTWQPFSSIPAYPGMGQEWKLDAAKVKSASNAGARWEWNLEAMKAQEGMRIRYRLVARDFCEPANAGYSQEYAVRVKPSSEISEIVAQMLSQVRQEVDRVYEQHTKGLMIRAQSCLDTPEAPEKRTVLYETVLEQAKMTQDLQKHHERLGEIRDYIKINKLNDSEVEHERDSNRALEAADRSFTALIGNPQQPGLVPQAAEALNRAREKGPGVDVDLLMAGLRKQEAVEEELRKLLATLQTGLDIREIVTKMRTIHDMIKRVADKEPGKK